MKHYTGSLRSYRSTGRSNLSSGRQEPLRRSFHNNLRRVPNWGALPTLPSTSSAVSPSSSPSASVSTAPQEVQKLKRLRQRVVVDKKRATHSRPSWIPWRWGDPPTLQAYFDKEVELGQQVVKQHKLKLRQREITYPPNAGDVESLDDFRKRSAYDERGPVFLFILLLFCAVILSAFLFGQHQAVA
ncbi:MAG: hypothetical protein AAFW73_07330 [Bacteroidota bacterium]